MGVAEHLAEDVNLPKTCRTAEIIAGWVEQDAARHNVLASREILHEHASKEALQKQVSALLGNYIVVTHA